MRALHSPDAVFSLRHVPSWLSLAFSAGAVNVIAFFACSRFVTHVTGTVSRIGMDASTVTLAFDYAVVLGCFVVGAMVSTTLLEGRHAQKKRPLFAVPLLLVAGIEVALAFAGRLGVFGDFGGSVEGPRDFAFLSIVAFAMGMQNASVATSTGLLVRTTHMTGPATDLGVHLASSLYLDGDARRTARRQAALRAGKIFAFAAGGAAGATLARSLGYAAFVAPAIVVTLATMLSFVDVSVTSNKSSKEPTR